MLFEIAGLENQVIRQEHEAFGARLEPEFFKLSRVNKPLPRDIYPSFVNGSPIPL